MRCNRCGGADRQPGVGPENHVDTVTIRINDTVELLRVALCTPCRSILVAAIQHVLSPAGRPAA